MLLETVTLALDDHVRLEGRRTASSATDNSNSPKEQYTAGAHAGTSTATAVLVVPVYE